MKYLIGLKKHKSPLHSHKNYEIIVCSKGSSLIQLAGNELLISEGNIIIVPPNTPHGSLDDTEWERLYISGELHPFFNLSKPVVVGDNAEGEGLSLARIIYNNRYSNNEYLSFLVSAFAYFLLNSMHLENTISVAVKNISDTIIQDFHDANINLSGILRKSGYAEDYIRAQFKKATAKTPTEFLTQIRISHACYLIEMYKNSLSLSEIAEKCGYVDYVYFSRKFKQLVGVSPKTYRQGRKTVVS